MEKIINIIIDGLCNNEVSKEEAKKQLLNLHIVSERSISEHDKIKMAGEWSRERSEGNRDVDRQCYYDYYMGIEAAERKLNAR
ncbi:MAG: hypothetical protein JXQ96_23400 [Cyclobacteriaceae bacterium]